jgi:hypothetical protein
MPGIDLHSLLYLIVWAAFSTFGLCHIRLLHGTFLSGTMPSTSAPTRKPIHEVVSVPSQAFKALMPMP